jgi:hypothetical protein
MKLYSSPMLGFVCLASVLAMDTKFDCKDLAAAGLLDALFFGASVAVDAQQAADNQAAQGAPGAPGEQGPAGADGATGAAGADGADGADGVDGADGANGVDGAAGAEGANGADGAAGLAGEPGADGADGVVGPAGPAGADGMDGVDTGNVLSSGYVLATGVLANPQNSQNPTMVERLAPGIYQITVDLTGVLAAERGQTVDQYAVLLQLEAFDGDVFGELVVAELRWPFYQTFVIEEEGQTVGLRVLVQVRQLESGTATVDNPFSFAIMGV